MESGSSFSLTGTKDAFNAKAGDIFGALDTIQYAPTNDSEGFLKNDPSKDVVGGSKHSHCGKIVRPHLARSLMPPPHAPVPSRRRRRTHPGFVRNPEGYTKYTLADVPDDQMSQKSNALAASQFLRELDARRAKCEEEPPSEGGKVLFRKPKSHMKSVAEETETEPKGECTSQSSSQPSRPSKKTKKRGLVTLSHLDYEDE